VAIHVEYGCFVLFFAASVVLAHERMARLRSEKRMFETSGTIDRVSAAKEQDLQMKV
jgi:hypothetical protein